MKAALCMLLVAALLLGFGAKVTYSDFPFWVDKRWAVLICGWLEFQVGTEIAYNLTVQYGFNDVLYLSPVMSSPRVDYVASKMNVRWALSTWLSSRADSDDLVFIFVSSHGGGCNATGSIEDGRVDEDGDEPLKDYWNGTTYVGVDESIVLQRHVANKAPGEYTEENFERYWDDEMHDDLTNVEYGRLVCLFSACKTENSTSDFSCFSGGFCSDISGESRIIIASSKEKEYSIAHSYGAPYFDDWGVQWDQFLGYFAEPFLDCLCQYSPDFLVADINEDMLVSFKEAFDYGLANDVYYPGDEHPVLEDTQNSLLNDGALSWLTCLDGWSQPSIIPPDINDNGYVDGKDAVLLGISFGTSNGEQQYNPDADINKDDFINGEDAVILGNNFGEGLDDFQRTMKLGNPPKIEYLTLLEVQPNENVFYTTNTDVGDTFNVSIIVQNVSCLYGWEIALEWNYGMINCTGETVNYDFWTYYLGPWVANPIDNNVGRYHQSLTARDPAQSFNGTTWLVNLTFQIVQAPPEGGAVSTELTITTTIGTDYCLLSTSSSEIPHDLINGHYTYISPRYMRSDLHSINGLQAYKLGSSQSASYLQTSVTDTESNTVYWGIRVWKRSSAGTETEITSGTPVAQVSRSLSGYGVESATWNCPNTTLTPTDSIVVRVYCKSGGDWTLQATFTTTQLNAQTADPTTWTVYYWTKRNYIPSGLGRTVGYFRWGTTTYNSRIENFTVTPN